MMQDWTLLQQFVAVSPQPQLTPEHVIWSMLYMLRLIPTIAPGQCPVMIQNDYLIPLVHTFASPANRALSEYDTALPPIIEQYPGNFDIYKSMIGFTHALMFPMMIIGDVAQQRVRLTRENKPLLFTFLLSCQTDPPYVGCWMIDAVYREN